MSRSVSWRRMCTEEVSKRINETLQSTIYILNQTGPAAFVLTQEGVDKKFKVCICIIYIYIYIIYICLSGTHTNNCLDTLFVW